jgi:ferric enterobactin receptor
MFFLSYCHAQKKQSGNSSKITGKVFDSLNNLPIEYATITLYKQGDKKAINGTITDHDGVFTITDVPTGEFKAVIEFIGYKSLTINSIDAEQNSVADLKTIFLSKANKTPQNVTVTTTAKLIDNKIDKLVFNAEKDITSQTGVATDVLKKYRRFLLMWMVM